MLTWLCDLQPVYAEAVEVAIQMPPMPLRNGYVLDELIEANMHDTHPEPVARLLDYLRRCDLSQTVWRQARDAIDRLLASAIPEELKASLEEILAEHGLD